MTGLLKRFVDLVNLLRFSLKKFQDDELLHAVLSHGTNWTTIAATHAPKRTTLALKNHYSALRLKHKNRETRKDSRIQKRQLSGSHGRPLSLTSTRQYDKTQNDLQKLNFENEAIEDEEGDDGEDNSSDNEDGDEGDEVNNDNLLVASLRTHENKTDDKSQDSTGGISESYSKQNLTTTSTWAGFSETCTHFQTNTSENLLPPGSSIGPPELVMNNATNPLNYLNTSSLEPTTIYAGEPFFGTIQNNNEMSIGMYTSCSKSLLAKSSSPNANHTKAPHFTNDLRSPDVSSHHYSASMSDHSGSRKRRRPDFSRSDVSNGGHDLAVLSSESMTESNSSSMSWAADPSGSVLHRVSINMICTTGQLGSLMTELAGAGTCINVKVDP